MFSVYNSVGLQSNQLGDESPAYNSRAFRLLERTNLSYSDLTDGSKNMAKAGMFNITGIANEPPELSYSTTWTNGPGTNLANKVNDLFKNDMFRMMASANPRYKPILLSDGWTQQYPKEGAKLTTTLNFRAYPEMMYNTTDYFTIYKMLFYCSAPSKYDFGDNIKNFLEAVETSMKTGTKFGVIVNQMLQDISSLRKNPNMNLSSIGANNEKPLDYLDRTLKEHDRENDKAGLVLGYSKKMNTIKDEKERLITSAAYLVTLLESFAQNSETACPRFTFGFGKLFNVGGYLHWVISGWSSKPAVNTTRLNDGTICPIYVDFTINLQTAGKVGTTDLLKIVSGNLDKESMGIQPKEMTKEEEDKWKQNFK